MGGFLRPDLQTLLAQAPSGTPDMPVFEPDAIPPVFGPQFPDPNELETIEMPVSEELGPVSAGQPVPAVKQSRGDRLRALLGNFLQNFGTGLQAAARAPSGAGFAAGFGAALSAPEERRQQQAREELLRENQRFRQEQAAEIQEIRERQVAVQEQSRLDRQAAISRQGIFRKEERLQRRFEDILEDRRRKQEKEETRTFLKGQQQERLGATAEQGRLSRQLQREQATTRAAGRGGISFKDAYAMASQEARIGISAQDPLGRDPTFETGKEAIGFLQNRAIAIFKEFNGIGPTREEREATRIRFDVLRKFAKIIDQGRQGGSTEEEIATFIDEAVEDGELRETEARELSKTIAVPVPQPAASERFLKRLEEGKTRPAGTTPIPSTIP